MCDLLGSWAVGPPKSKEYKATYNRRMATLDSDSPFSFSRQRLHVEAAAASPNTCDLLSLQRLSLWVCVTFDPTGILNNCPEHHRCYHHPRATLDTHFGPRSGRKATGLTLREAWLLLSTRGPSPTSLLVIYAHHGPMYNHTPSRAGVVCCR